METLTPKQRMLNAYRGLPVDRIPVAPEFWTYYPARLLGVDLIEFERNVPFHEALKTTFETFGCEGWCNTSVFVPNERAEWRERETYRDAETLEIQTEVRTPAGVLVSRRRYTRDEPSWSVEGWIKDPVRDLPAWEHLSFGGDLSALDPSRALRARETVGESFLLELGVCSPFFDAYAASRDGGFEAAVLDFLNPELTPTFERIHKTYIERQREFTRALCEKTPFESLFIGCAWSCNSLIGPMMWRRWDKPVIRAVVEEAHRHGRLVHIHFHGRCLETLADFAELGIDCVCPFERPPGGDVRGEEGLRIVEKVLRGKVTMNGNVHTVETLIRGTPQDVRREVREILRVFEGNPRLIVGTGDQVGRETPEENLHALIEEVRQATPAGGGKPEQK